jgi:hypothetical protein
MYFYCSLVGVGPFPFTKQNLVTMETNNDLLAVFGQI